MDGWGYRNRGTNESRDRTTEVEEENGTKVQMDGTRMKREKLIK